MPDPATPLGRTVTITPIPTPTPVVPTPAPVALQVRVRAATLSRDSGRLALSGSAHRAFTGRVSVRVRARIHRTWRTRTLTAPVRRGTLRTTVQLPRTWARAATAVRVTISWPGSSRFGAGSTTHRVRLR